MSAFISDGEITVIHNDRVKNNGEVCLIHTIHDFLIHLKAAGRSSSTVLCYLRNLKLLLGVLGNMKLGQICDRHLEDVIIQLGGFSRGSSGRAAATMNQIKSVYRSFFKWSFESKLISSNPAAHLRMAKTGSRPTIPITIEEIAYLLDTIRKSRDHYAGRDEALFATYAFTGIRRAEALSLKIRDYNPLSLTLFLPQAKGGNRRIQLVPSPLAEILERHIHYLKSNGGKSSDYSPLFPGRHPEWPLSARQAQFRFDKWKGLAGIRKDLTIHSFRAGFATLLYQTTGNILLVACAMGHRDIRTTRRYIGDNTSAIREAIERTFRNFSSNKVAQTYLSNKRKWLLEQYPITTSSYRDGNRLHD